MLKTEATVPLERSIVVIGAGIVGAAVALTLMADGHKVTVIDHSEVGAGASFGNAGGIVTGAVTPIATPAVVRPRHFIQAIPWTVRFVASFVRGQAIRKPPHVQGAP